MLNMILWIVKMIGIVLLVLLGILLGIVLLILLVPIRYQLSASYHEAVRAKARISWLFRFLSVLFTYEETLEYEVKILGFSVCSSLKKTTSQLESVVQTQVPQKMSQQPESLQAPVAEKAPKTQEVPRTQETPKMQEMPRIQTTPEVLEEQELPKTLGVPKVTALASRIWQKISGFAERIKNRLASLKQKKEQICRFLENPENQATLRLLLRQLRSILKHLLPRKVKVDLVLGFDDPATTGQVLSLFSLLYVWYGDAINLTPVFDQSVIEGDAQIKGRIRIGTLLVLAVRILLNKNFRVLLKRWRMNGGILDG